jgi:hypothetical protein
MRALSLSLDINPLRTAKTAKSLTSLIEGAALMILNHTA